jgi:CIC family chloride channel protein
VALRRQQISIILSLVIGVTVGLVTVAFLLVKGRLAARMYPAGGAAWRRLVLPAAGSLISGILLYKYFPDARGSGIPQTKFAIFINDGYISLRTAMGKFLCCGISLASGIALGREGPSVHIGAGIASVLSRRFELDKQTVKDMIPVGCSAALAAAFNTPIAAVLFSLEEVLGDLHAPVLGSVVISSATSWIVLHMVLGDEPLFHVPAYQLVHPAEFGIYALLGIVGGLGSVCFVKLLLNIRKWFARLPKSTVWAQPVVGGLLVGVLGWFMPEVLGVGYDYVERVLGGDFTVKTVALLAMLKIVATAVCYSSGNAGGIFGPSLFIGAMIGGATGAVAHHFLPGITANAGAYALVGMGTAFAGIVRTPLTSVIMIFEMTRDYSIIVPLMISNLVSFFVSRLFQPIPIYEALALQEGVLLPSGEGKGELSSLRISAVMRTDCELFAPDLDVQGALSRLKESGRNAWPVGQSRNVDGLVTSRQLEEVADPKLLLKEVINSAEHFAYVHADQSLAAALEEMGRSGADALPVVSRANIHELHGVVTLPQVMEAYGLARGLPGSS